MRGDMRQRMRRPFLSVRAKIVWLTSAVMIAALIGLAYLVVSLFSAGLRRGTDELLYADMEALRSLVTVNPDRTLELFAFGDTDANAGMRFQIKDARGEILLAAASVRELTVPAPPLGQLTRAGVWRDAGINEELVRVYSAPLTVGTGAEKRVLLAQTLRSIQPFRYHEQRLIRLLIVFSPVPLVLVMLGSWWVARYSLRPLDDMVAAVRIMHADDLSQRLPVARDDEVGRLANTFNVLLERLERAFTSLRRFTADASHELRSPLTALRTQAEVALTRARSPESYRDSLGAMLEDVARLERLVDTLLQLARGDAGMVQAQWASVDLGALVGTWAERFSVLTEERQQSLDLDIAPGVTVRADRAILERAIVNVLDNAVQFAPAGGRIAICVRASAREAVVSIADNGPGIPAAARAQVFERFVRLDPARARAGGAGLGLAIAKWAVDLHGGRIEIDPAHSPGCRVVITLNLSNSS